MEPVLFSRTGWLGPLVLLIIACAPTPEGAPFAPASGSLPAGTAPTLPSGAVPTLPPPPTPMPLPSAPRLTVPRQGSFIFYEDFEKGLDRWNLSGGSGGVGWTRLNAFTCGGAWTMLLGTPEWTPYREVVGEAFLTTKAPIDLAKANRPHLFFDVRGEAEPAEALATQAEVSPDGKVWQPIGEPTTARHRFVSTLFADLTPFRGSGLYLRFRARLQVRTAPTKGLLLDDIHLIEPDLSAPVR